MGTEASPVMKNFVIDPSISRTAKAADSTKNMMASLAEGGRMGEVFKVISMYSELLSAAKGDAKAVITSAEELSAAEVKEIQESLANFTDSPGTTKVAVEVVIDKSLISGITVEMGSKYIDPS